MSKIQLGLAPTNVKLRVKLMDSSLTTGAGLTGLSSASSGLLISTLQLVEGANGEASATVYTGGNLETIATLGTYANPTGGKCRFKEVDATNHPGIYELQFTDARFSATGDATKAMTLLISISGATNLAQADIEVECRNQAVNVIQINGTAQTARDIGASVLLSAGTGTGQIDFSSGVVKSNMTQIDGNATSGNNATLNLKKLDIQNTTGNAVNIAASGSGHHGIAVESTHISSAGDAVYVHSNSKHAVGVYSGGNADALHLEGSGTGHGVSALGGATGNGINATAYSGHGMKLLGATNGDGLRVEGAGTGSGLRTVGAGSGAGISATGGIDGHGIDATGGAGSSSAGRSGIYSLGQGVGHGLNVVGSTTGAGIRATGGATGPGIHAEGGPTSGSGLLATGTNTGNGINATGGTNGNGLKATGGASAGNGIEAISTTEEGILAQGSNKGLNCVSTAGGVGLATEGVVGIKADGTSYGIYANGASAGMAAYATAAGPGFVAHGTPGIAAEGATDAHGIHATGDGTGSGLYLNGGATNGDGITAVAGAGGDGCIFSGQGGGTGLVCSGNGNGRGIYAEGGVSGNDIELSSHPTSMTQLSKSAETIVSGTVDDTAFAPTTTQFECSDITDAAADFYTGRTVIFSSGTLGDQARRIVAYSLVTGRGHFTVEALTSAPATGVSLVIV